MKDSAVADAWGERMPRSVGLLQTVALSVGVTIGSGIFRVPAIVAGQLQSPGPMLVCWVLGGLEDGKLDGRRTAIDDEYVHPDLPPSKLHQPYMKQMNSHRPGG